MLAPALDQPAELTFLPARNAAGLAVLVINVVALLGVALWLCSAELDARIAWIAVP